MKFLQQPVAPPDLAKPTFWTGSALLLTILKIVAHADQPSAAMVTLAVCLACVHLLGYRVAALRSLRVGQMLQVMMEEQAAKTERLEDILRAAVTDNPEKVKGMLYDSQRVHREQRERADL